MSEMADTLALTIERAVEEWLASHGGGMSTGYAVVVNYFDSEGEPGWATAHAERQTPAHTLGLLRWHTMATEHQIVGYFDSEDDL